MQQLNVRMIRAFRKHTGNDPPLLGYTQSTLSAELFDVDRLVHTHPKIKVAPQVIDLRGAFSTARETLLPV